MALVPLATLREQPKRWYLFRASHLVNLVALVALVPLAALKKQPKRWYISHTYVSYGRPGGPDGTSTSGNAVRTATTVVSFPYVPFATPMP
ncbi:hypothetical protein F4775DRAFT_486587 [Biscogniauxia sp. FL1348]|nr:hypothetical protein F4775DRAFT_486587 [Biscogniauxia sp. FL1348]